MLTPIDFGVEMQSDDELAVIKENIELTVGVADPIGAYWDDVPEDLELAPRLLAAPALQPRTYVSRIKLVLEGGSAPAEAVENSRKANWNLLVTGKRGVGMCALHALNLSRYDMFSISTRPSDLGSVSSSSG